MNRFSRIRHHVNMEDVKRRHLQEVAAKKLEEKILKKETEQIKEKYEKLKSNWRRENLREFGEWAPIETSGPTNSTSTTFGYFVGGSPAVNYETGQQITFTYSGLNGIENYPTSITIDQGFGEVHTTNPPPFSQIGVQGYTAKLNPKYAEAKKKYDKEYAEWEKRRDKNLKKIKNTLKSFGTSFEELRASKDWVKELGDGTFVAIMPTSPNADVMNWTDNVRIVKLRQAANADPMYIDYNTKEIDPLTGKKYPWMAHNIEIQNDVYLQIGKQPKAPMESEYLMPRRLDYKDVNPLLDVSQEFAQKVGADYMMNARVKDTPEQQAAIDAWNAKLRAMMDKHQKEWDALGRGYTKKQEMALANKQAAEINPLWDAEPKFAQQVGADAFMGERSAAANAEKQELAKAEAQRRREAAAPEPAPEPAPESAPIPILDYGVNIARSIAANKPIRIPQSKIPQSEIDKLVQGISNSPGTLYRIPINTKEEPYSDENIYELPNGEVRTHTAGTKARYGNNTMHVDLNDLGHFGNINPLAAAGQAQLQIVKPEDGEPYLVYTDHAYRNLTSTDPGEASYNPLVGAADWVVHTVLGKNDPNKPNTGAMANYPPNIKGDVRKQIRVPYSQLTQMIKHHINFPGRKKRKKKEEEEVVESTWSKLKKHQKRG